MRPTEPRSLPLLAADPVALAILEGRQTQHRVPMRPGPTPFVGRPGWSWHPKSTAMGLVYYSDAEFREGSLEHARWRVGDSFYVRECWQLVQWRQDAVDGEWLRSWEGPAPSKRPAEWEPVYRAGWAESVRPRWRPNILCPEWAARTITKPLTSVWAERVQDISEDDALAEGIQRFQLRGGHYYATAQDFPFREHGETARDAFRMMWESLYPGSWERNDWIWCCEWPGVEVRT